MSRYPVVNARLRTRKKESRCAREERILIQEARTAEVLAAFRKVLLDVKADIAIGEVVDAFIDFRRKATHKWLFPSFFDRIACWFKPISIRRVVCHGTICAVERSDGMICAFFALRGARGDLLRGQMHAVDARRPRREMIKTRHGAYASREGVFSLFMNSVRNAGQFGTGTLYSAK